MKKHLLEENPHFEYYRTISKENIDFEVYDNLYEECFYLAWINPKTKKVEEWGCETFNNNFHMVIDDILETYKERSII